MIYRKLNFDYSNDIIAKLEAFLKQAIGKKYKFSLSKLTAKKTISLDEIRRFREL